METSWITFWSLSMLYFMQRYASLQVMGHSPVWKSSHSWGATVSLVYLQIFLWSSPSIPVIAPKLNQQSHFRPDAPCVSAEAGKAAFSFDVPNKWTGLQDSVEGDFCRTSTCVLWSRDTILMSDINMFWFLSFYCVFARCCAVTFYEVQWIFLQSCN